MSNLNKRALVVGLSTQIDKMCAGVEALGFKPENIFRIPCDTDDGADIPPEVKKEVSDILDSPTGPFGDNDDREFDDGVLFFRIRKGALAKLGT